MLYDYDMGSTVIKNNKLKSTVFTSTTTNNANPVQKIVFKICKLD